MCMFMYVRHVGDDGLHKDLDSDVEDGENDVDGDNFRANLHNKIPRNRAPEELCKKTFPNQQRYPCCAKSSNLAISEDCWNNPP